jgi:hypothetical protein
MLETQNEDEDLQEQVDEMLSQIEEEQYLSFPDVVLLGHALR